MFFRDRVILNIQFSHTEWETWRQSSLVSDYQWCYLLIIYVQARETKDHHHDTNCLMRQSFIAGPCNAWLKGLEEAVFFSIQEDSFQYRSGGVHSHISDFKKNAIYQICTEFQCKITSWWSNWTLESPSHSCTSLAGAMGSGHRLHTVIHPSLLSCPLAYETSCPQCKVNCSLVSIYICKPQLKQTSSLHSGCLWGCKRWISHTLDWQTSLQLSNKTVRLKDPASKLLQSDKKFVPF